MNQTSQTHGQMTFPLPTAGASVFPARTSAYQEGRKEYAENVQGCFLELQTLLKTQKKKISPHTCSLKTLSIYPLKRGRVGKDRALTLTTECQQATITPSGRIRKLTPREYFRLQGFPDWAFEAVTSIRTANETGISDTQLYNLAGNAVSVPVIYEIAKILK